jgi:pimeloyl-ACP methyl ester carboxylesterase
MPYVIVDRGGCFDGKVNLYYEVFGDSGPRVFFVMGFGTAFQAWAEQLSFLSESGAFQAVAFDNRGFGRSSSPYGRYTSSQLAEDAADLLRHIKWTDNIHLVGHSLGGMIAQELVLAYPEWFISLLLLNTHGGIGSVPIWRSLPPLRSLLDMTRFTLATDPLSAIQHQLALNCSEEFLLARPISRPSSPTPDRGSFECTNRAKMFENYFDWWKSHGVVSWAGQLGQVLAVFTHHLTPTKCAQLAANPIPKVVFSSESDRIIATASSELLAKSINAQLISVTGGHLVNLEHRDLVNEHLLKLIKATDPVFSQNHKDD